jgi:flagellar biosynthesis anti-sigma factor FlgM
MRIDLNEVSLNGLQRESKAQKTSGKASGTPNVKDQIDLSLDTVRVSSLEANALSVPQVRQDKVDALREIIHRGQYKVEPDKVADALIRENKS